METAPGSVEAPAGVQPQQPAAAEPTSNLAMVVDKRPPHRPGGCIGIFFQLFDWNRRLAKKRFFSRRLLPQDRAAKRISKKFASEQNMPAATKPAVIAAENRGGFLNTKKAETETAIRPSVHNSDREKRMISPGLVARLMGLDSMPAAVARLDKPRKAVDDVSSSSDGGRHIDHSGTTSGSPCRKPKLDVERGGSGHGKLQLRPQKLQKLGFFDRRPTSASRVGSESLLFSRGMLARSRKQHYKLASPVKSPRISGRRSSARLMEAATRILEPGLQSRSRTRSALTYMAPLQVNVEGMQATPLQRPNVGAPLVSPCHNCGSLVEVPDLRLRADESPSMECRTSPTCSDFSSTSSHGGFDEAAATNPLVIPKESKRTPSLAIQAKANVQSRSHYFVERKSRSRNELHEHGKPQPDVTGSTSSSPRQNNLRQNEMALVREKVAPPPRLGTRLRGRREHSSFAESKDFIASNGNLRSHTQARAAKAILANRRIELEGSAWSWERKSSVCRGKSAANNIRTENIAAINLAFAKKKAAVDSMPNGKGPRLMTARSIHGNSVKCEIQRLGGGGKCGTGRIKTAGIHSPTGRAAPAGNSSMPYGNSPMPCGLVTEKRRDAVGHGHVGISESGALSTDSKTGKLSPERALDGRINALSDLLEQKIRELTCLDLDRLEGRDGVRPTAAILEQLISALSAARAISLKRGDDPTFRSGMQDASCYDGKGPSGCTSSCGPIHDAIQNYQPEAKSGVSLRVLHTNDYEQHSPMSILEASFSNDSCLSESFNSSSGLRPHAGFMESSFDKLLPWDIDADLSDSATSSNIRIVEPVKATPFGDNLFLMHGMDLHRVCSSGNKFNYFREVILNAELLFGNTFLNMHDGKPYSPVDPILLDTLVTLVNALGGCHICKLSHSEDRDRLQFRIFIFDCIIEHLDMKYGHYAKTGYKTWAKMPLLTGDRLSLEIYEEIISCRDQAGEILDEIVQKEMSRTDGEWMYFQFEAFEAGVEIEDDLLQLLVDEIVIDLLHC